MLRKIKKVMNDIKNFKFFNYYGSYFREEAIVDSDFETNIEKQNMTIDKLLNQSVIKKSLIENNVCSSDSFDNSLLQSTDNIKLKKEPEKDPFNELQSALIKYTDIKKNQAVSLMSFKKS